jgi:cephalosporin hydroxylase
VASQSPQRISIDLEQNRVIVEGEAGSIAYRMDEAEAFEVVSDAWLRCGWDNKYVYSFSWMGRPIIQLPDDMFRIQEIIFSLKPNVIVETGVAHGGSLIFYASLCKAMDKGRVVGVDIEIRPHNREAIEAHPLFPLITLIEGDSTDPGIVELVKSSIEPDDTVLVLLDSSHTKEHVLAELNAYAPLVSQGSYVVAMDGIMEQVVGAPRTQPDWAWNNPRRAALEFVEKNPDFVIIEPPFPFNEGNTSERVTYWPSGFIKKVGRSCDR